MEYVLVEIRGSLKVWKKGRYPIDNVNVRDILNKLYCTDIRNLKNID